MREREREQGSVGEWGMVVVRERVWCDASKGVKGLAWFL